MGEAKDFGEPELVLQEGGGPGSGVLVRVSEAVVRSAG